METLTRLSNSLQKYTTRYYIIPLVILFAILAVTMERSPIGTLRLKALSGGAGMLDMLQFGYSETTAYGVLAQIGPAGRTLYAQLLGLDVVFAIVYMLMQSVLLTNLLRRANVTGHWRLLNLLPWLRSGLDLLENGALFGLLSSFPARLSALVFVASTLTQLKWLVYGVVIVLLLALGVWTSMRTHQPQNKLQKAGKTL
jgi:hypothetical protein